MKTLLKWSLGLCFLAVVVISAVGALPDHLQAAAAGPSSFDTDMANNGVMLKAEDQVRRMLKDPDSAKFGAVYLVASSKAVPPPKPEADTVCGYVNAKNSFGGGYVGSQHVHRLPLALSRSLPRAKPMPKSTTRSSAFGTASASGSQRWHRYREARSWQPPTRVAMARLARGSSRHIIVTISGGAVQEA